MRSIVRSKKHANLITILTSKDPNTGVSAFPTIKALQCYAAMIGFDQGRREPLEKGESENIEWHTFNNDGYTDYIYLIALAATGNLSVLKYDVETSDACGFSEDMVKIFEEYANGGFQVLQSWLDKSPGDPYGSKALISGIQRAGYLIETGTKEKFDEVEF